MAELPALVQAPLQCCKNGLVWVGGLGYSTLHNTEVYDMKATEVVGKYYYYHLPPTN
jgi:hypothetical protein